MSAQEEQALFDAREAEKQALGIVSEPIAEETPNVETPENKPEVKEEEVTKTKEESEEEPDPEGDLPEEEEEIEEETDEEETPESTRVAPMDSIKELKSSYKAQIKALEAKLEEAMSSKGKEEAISDINKFIEEKASKLGLNPEILKELSEINDKVFENKYGDKIKKIDEYEQSKQANEDQKFKSEQEQIFNTEWNATKPVIEERFKNISPEQAEKAKALMDKLSHSREYHLLPMEEIFNAKSKEFEKILYTPNGKAFETGRNLRPTPTEEFEGVGDISNKTPGEVEAIEQRRNAHMASFEREKMMLTSQDQDGNIIRREV